MSESDFVRQNYPLEILKEQRAFCLNNFISALEQVEGSTKGTEKRLKGRKWMLRNLSMLDEIDILIEESERATMQDQPAR